MSPPPPPPPPPPKGTPNLNMQRRNNDRGGGATRTRSPVTLKRTKAQVPHITRDKKNKRRWCCKAVKVTDTGPKTIRYWRAHDPLTPRRVVLGSPPRHLFVLLIPVYGCAMPTRTHSFVSECITTDGGEAGSKSSDSDPSACNFEGSSESQPGRGEEGAKTNEQDDSVKRERWSDTEGHRYSIRHSTYPTSLNIVTQSPPPLHLPSLPPHRHPVLSTTTSHFTSSTSFHIVIHLQVIAERVYEGPVNASTCLSLLSLTLLLKFLASVTSPPRVNSFTMMIRYFCPLPCLLYTLRYDPAVFSSSSLRFVAVLVVVVVVVVAGDAQAHGEVMDKPRQDDLLTQGRNVLFGSEVVVV
ncbi:hypothetical protein O3P69_001380 [Scylla paramamosain]|uniref:Uncharacterized protein n=1 Tax=Scylla paramamosain TaxID=85552 RepID=A0AAW0UUJ6_SCYPA